MSNWRIVKNYVSDERGKVVFFIFLYLLAFYAIYLYSLTILSWWGTVFAVLYLIVAFLASTAGYALMNKKKYCRHDYNTMLERYNLKDGTPMINFICYDCDYTENGHVYGDTWEETIYHVKKKGETVKLVKEKK